MVKSQELSKFLKFMPVAKAIAGLSRDPSTQVGAIAFDERLNIIAVGYNGFPRGVKDHLDRYLDRNMKLRLISHAEQNLVAQAAYGGRSLAGATVLVTSLFPCSNCTKSLIQAGVSCIIAPHPETQMRWAAEANLANMMFNEAGVKVVYHSEVGHAAD